MPSHFKIITQLFPVWASLFSIFAFYRPDFLIELKPGIIPLLAIIMLGMGMTLTLDDFRRVLREPVIILTGLCLQYLIMPLAAYSIALALNLPIELLVGMVLVGASAGGTASNVICYLAKGDVALSITLTLCSTLIAVIAMPLLTLFYIGERVPVPAVDMFLTVLKIVVAPVCLGVALNQLAGKKLDSIKSLFPVISVLAIILIIGIIVALNHQRIDELNLFIVMAVMLHNITGLLSGYWITIWLGYNRRVCRTVAIEVGMQNSGLSVALAIKYFTPLAALPGAIFSIWHNISGSILAAWWSRNPGGH